MVVHYSQQQQFRMASALAGVAAADQTATTLFPQTLGAPPQVISEPVSELTCNISGSRKRAREDEPLIQATTTPGNSMPMYQQQRLILQKQYQRQILFQSQIQLSKTQPNVVPVDNSRLNESVITSTSGRPITTQDHSPYSDSVFLDYRNTNNNNYNTSTAACTDLSSPSTSLLLSLLNQHSLEVDDLVRFHTDKLRSVLDDARNRQCRALLSAVAQQAQGRISQKQAEVEAAEKRNAELQNRLRQALVESQAWFNVVRNNEAVIANLQERLEQALMQNIKQGKHGDRGNDCGNNKCVQSQLEGYGDSEEEAGALPAASTAVGRPTVTALAENPSDSPIADRIHYSPCKSCGASDGCVLVLPCRHLCLCQSCESSTDEYPVCHCRKNGSLPINLS